MLLQNFLKGVPGRRAVKKQQCEIAYDTAQGCYCIINNAEGCIIYMSNIGLAYEESFFLQFVSSSNRQTGSHSRDQKETRQFREMWEAKHRKTLSGAPYCIS